MTSTTPDQRAALAGRLRAAGCVFAEDEAELLLGAAGTPGELEALVARRVAGHPLEHVLGWAEFCGLRVAVEPGVFVPRRRTEFLAREAAALIRPGGTAVELCCGAGAIGAVLAAAAPGVELHAADVDPAAVRCARRNLGPDRVYEGDLYAPLPDTVRGRVDVLVVNAPYVPSGEVPLMPAEARLYEPLVALDGGADGLDVLRSVIAGARQWLAPGGHLLAEASERQAPVAADLITASGLTARVIRSADHGATVVVGELSGS